MLEPWRIQVEDGPTSNKIPWRLALEVDPQRRRVWLGPRVEGSGDLDIQSGAVARSFFETGPINVAAAAQWLQTEEALALLETLHAGFQCDTLWTGDPVVHWSDDAWAAGHALWERISRFV